MSTGDFCIGRDIEDLVEFREDDREDDREADLLKKLLDLLCLGDWYWSQNDSGDSVVLSRELEGVEVDTGGLLTCSSEI